MNIIKAYKYLFYRTYLWQLNAFGETNNPQLAAMLVNSSCVSFNLITLIACFQIIADKKILYDNIYPFILMVAIMLINYFFFLYKNRFQKVIDEFTPENNLQKKNRAFWYWGYLIFTHGTFLASVYILSPNSK